MFQALALCSDKGLTQKASGLETVYNGQFTLSALFIRPNYCVIPPLPAQKHSFFRYLPPL